MRLEVEAGDICVEVARLWHYGTSFVVALTLSEKQAGCELVTGGMMQQFQLFVIPGQTTRDGMPVPVRKSTLVTLDEPGWLVGIEVSGHTAILTGVRDPFGGKDGVEVDLVYVDEEEDSTEDDGGAWQRELAMEAGMLHGIDAYNDAMGCSLEPPEED